MQLLTCVVSCKYKCLIATYTKWFMRTFISFLQSNILSLTECEEVIFVAIDFYFDLWQFFSRQSTNTNRLWHRHFDLTKKIISCSTPSVGKLWSIFIFFTLSLSLIFFWKFNNKFYYFVARGQVAEFFMISSHIREKV